MLITLMLVAVTSTKLIMEYIYMRIHE